LYAAAKLGVADLLADGPQTTAQLAGQLEVKESPLYRTLRLLASQGVFEETAPRTFAQTALSRFLCTGVPGSVRSTFIFRGSEFFFAPYGEILHSIETGQPAREKIFGMNGFDYLREPRIRLGSSTTRCPICRCLSAPRLRPHTISVPGTA
jgi:hypothetical protein